MNQLSLFNLDQFTHSPPPIPQCDPAWDDDHSQDPPDPDDYASLADYEQAWREWADKYPELVKYTCAMSPCDDVGGQVIPDTLPSREQVNTDTKKIAPQHDTTHWVEKYWVQRCGNKYWYFRYCWMNGRKIHRRYIGAVRSQIAQGRKEEVEIAIADGETPAAIEKLIHSWR